MKDLIVLGGGASGFISAIAFAKKNKGSVLIIEGNDRVLKKLSLTGNGQCNLTNVNCGKYFGDEDFANSVISNYDVSKTLKFFDNLGLKTVVESDGKVYPRSFQASSVSDLLRFTAEKLGITIVTNELVTEVKKFGEIFEITTNSGVHNSKFVIYSLGGAACPKLLTNSSNSKILLNLGHTTREYLPALCQISVKHPLMKLLKGIKCDVALSLFDGEKKVASYTNEAHFTGDALSGPASFSLSPYVSILLEKNVDNKGANRIEIDFFPELSSGELLELLGERAEIFDDFSLERFFITMLHNQVGRAVAKNANLPLDMKISDLTDEDLIAIMKSCKNFSVEVEGTYGFSYAQSSIGGVFASELNNSLESKIVPNLYVVGEAVNVCGECGGYNLQWAWSSGITAGEDIAGKNDPTI